MIECDPDCTCGRAGPFRRCRLHGVLDYILRRFKTDRNAATRRPSSSRRHSSVFDVQFTAQRSAQRVEALESPGRAGRGCRWLVRMAFGTGLRVGVAEI
jgi:hypothetical protein